jgi:hypothetical protein
MTVRKENNTWTVDVSSGKRAIDGKRNRHKKFGFATKEKPRSMRLTIRLRSSNKLRIKMF